MHGILYVILSTCMFIVYNVYMHVYAYLCICKHEFKFV